MHGEDHAKLPEDSAVPDARHESAGRTLRRVLDVVPRAPVRLEGASMWPLILPNTDAVVVRCRVEELRVGDLAVYVREGRVVAHVVRSHGSKGTRPSALGRIGLEDAITPEILLGRVDGMVFRRRHLPWIPRSVARSVALGVGIVMRMRAALHLPVAG